MPEELPADSFDRRMQQMEVEGSWRGRIQVSKPDGGRGLLEMNNVMVGDVLVTSVRDATRYAEQESKIQEANDRLSELNGELQQAIEIEAQALMG